MVRNCVFFSIPVLLSLLLHVMLSGSLAIELTTYVLAVRFLCVNCITALPSFACTASTRSSALMYELDT